MSRASALWTVVLVLSCLAAGAAQAVLVPAAPRGLTATDTPNDQGRCVDIQFIRSVDELAGDKSVTSYKVYLRAPGGSFNLVTTITASGKYIYSYRVLGMTKNVAHQIGVTALAGTVESTMTVIGATPLDNTAPRPPTLRAGVPTPDEGRAITLNITPSPDDGTGWDDVVIYTVYYRLSGATTWVRWGTVPATNATNYRVFLTGLQRNSTYELGVTAGDGDQPSTMTVITATTVDSQAPRPPTNAVATDVASDQGRALMLTFDKSPDDAGGARDVRQYVVGQRQGTAPFTEIGRLNATGAASYSLKIMALTPGSSYTFSVQATDGTNTSTRALATGTPVDNSAPRQPASLRTSVTVPSNGHSVGVIWGQSPDDGTGWDDVRRYFVYRKAPGELTFTKIGEVTAADQAYYSLRATGLTKNLTYTFGVTAFDGVQESSMPTATAVTNDTQAPGRPSSLTVADVPADNGFVLHLTIGRSPDDGLGENDVTSYLVSRLTGPGVWTPIGTVPATDAASYTYDATGLTPGTAYQFSVQATDGTNTSDRTTAGGTPINNVAPAPPTGLAAQPPVPDNGNRMRLTFARSADDGAGAGDVKRYNLYVAPAGSSTYSLKLQIPATGAATYEGMFTGLVPGRTYNFGVTAGDGTLLSTMATTTGTTQDNQAPQPPASPAVADVPADNGSALKLTFAKSPDDGGGVGDVKSYRITRRQGAAAFTQIATVTATKAATYQFISTGLTPGQTYEFGVEANDGVNLSTMVTATGTTVDNLAPAPPTAFVVTDIAGDNGDKLHLTFNRSADDGLGANDVTQYLVCRQTSPGVWAQINILPATDSASYACDATGLTPATTYQFSVQATDGVNTSARVLASGTTVNNVPPAAPTNLLAQPPVPDNGNRMRLTFARSADDGAGAGDVKRYNLYVAPAGGTTYALKLQITATGAATYEGMFTDLLPGRTYSFGVTAGDGTQLSTMVTTTGTTLDSTAPQPPTSPAAADVPGDNGTQLQISFAKSPDDGGGVGDVKSYRITQRQGAAAFTQVATVTATKAATYQTVIGGLTRGQSYDFGIEASDGVNFSTRVTTTGTPVDNLAPAPPTAFTVTDTPGDDGNALVLGFKRSADDGAGANDVVQYRLFREVSAGSWSQIATVPATGAASYTSPVSGLKPGTTYRYGVTADDGLYQSTRVEGSGVPVDNTVPGPPRNLVLADVPSDAGTALFVRFDASVDDVTGDREVTSYRITRGTATGPAGVGTQAVSTFTVTATGAASYEYRDTGLTAGTTYYYKVVAVAPTGESAPTAEVSGAPEDNRTISPPTGLAAQDRPYDDGGVIELSWTKSADDGSGQKLVTQYNVYRRMANVVTAPTKIGTVPATGTASYAWNDTTVPMDLILYDYTVTAVAASGKESTPAGPARASADDNNIVVFSPPTSLVADDMPADAGGQILLTWKRSTDEGEIGPPPPPPLLGTAGGYGGQYEFYRRTAATAYPERPTFVVSADGTDDPMSYVDKGLTNGTRYYYKAVYRRYNQISTFSNETSAIPAVGTGTAAASTSQAGGGTDATATLTVALSEPPATVAVGSDLVVTAQVSGAGASSVCLEWTLDGVAVQRTSAVSGQDGYAAQLTLKTASWARGTVVRVRALATDGQVTAASATADVTVQ